MGDPERGVGGHLPLRASGDLVVGVFRLRDPEVLRRALPVAAVAMPADAAVEAATAAKGVRPRLAEAAATSSADDVSLRRSPRNPLISLRVGQ